MKISKYFIAFITIISFIACKNDVKIVENNSSKTEIAIAKEPNLQNIEFDINGMTCEIGCAKLIQSKVYKLEGVSHSKVSFANKIGQFTFDSNKISAEEITKNINGIAGGELYQVTNHTIVDEFSEILETSEVIE